MEIRIISYEDREKYCPSGFFLAGTKTDIARMLIGVTNPTRLGFEDMKIVMSIIETLDYKK